MVTEKNPVVKTGSGKVMGETREGVAIFRGIPYGGTAGPGRRFMTPVPAESWEGVRDCTKNGRLPSSWGKAWQRALPSGSISAAGIRNCRGF